jgi:DNA helicase HerA-like ATPase
LEEIEMPTKVIGKVTATENKPTTYNTIRFWLAEDEDIRIFDVVRVGHTRGSYTYAIVRDLQFITDSAGHLANYVSSDFGDVAASPINRRLGTTIAEAEVLYNSKDIEMPVRDGAPVEVADIEGVRKALGLEGFKKPIPAGYISMSYGVEVPIEFEAKYLLGPEGAHLNIAGISGLATKTSYAMFLLNAVQQRLCSGTADELRERGVSMVLLNVKGSDLLSIDESPQKSLTQNQMDEWRKCGLEPVPFRNVSYLYPFAQKRAAASYSNTSLRRDLLARQHAENRAFNYFYDVEAMKDRMGLLLGDVEDPSSTLESIFDQIRTMDASSWDAFKAEIQRRTRPGQQSGGAIQVQSWRKFSRFIQTRTANPLFVEQSLTDAAQKRQKTVADAVRGLRPGHVLVVDIEQLPDYLQCLVVGDIVGTLRNIKLGEDEKTEPGDIGSVVVFADELNKYAPRSDTSGRSLTNILLEVTERGRSLGVLLFGAEQFRSAVHDRILGNCSTNAYGRTSPVEMHKCPDYHYFPDSHKASITRLEQGSLLLQHAVFKTHLIKVRFPFPCYFKEDTAR